MTESTTTHCCPTCGAAYPEPWQAEACAGTHWLEKPWSDPDTQPRERSGSCICVPELVAVFGSYDVNCPIHHGSAL